MSNCNILIVGGKSVGKTVIFNQITYRSTTPRFLYPISEDTGIASWTAQGQQINIQVRDTISATPTSINATLCRNLDIILFVYSLDRKSSVEELGEWHDLIYRFIPPDVISCLVGNKCDLVTSDEGFNDSIVRIKPIIGSKHNFKVSAVTGEGIPQMVEKIARDYLTKQPRQPTGGVIVGGIRTPPGDAYCCIN
ncbi:hypothetical protein LOD99_4545 [Oopsacas minuta]|uniref:Uncharacterized protein n=1 Tax=Oopsacas minuta TaxID=111878 RepID=A0AAV7JU68_9METZ|nr:hypothetical protein LOD99_4545 [Oopsacas minuta]